MTQSRAATLALLVADLLQQLGRADQVGEQDRGDS